MSRSASNSFSLGESHKSVYESITVAFIAVPLKMHFTRPKPISTKFLPFTIIYVYPVTGPQGGEIE